MSIHRIASEFDHSRNTIRKILKQAEPNPFPSTRDRFAPLLGPVEAVIDQILIDDESAPPKQRHTAAQVFRRLRDEHDYRGGYAQVQRYLRKHRRRHQETFIPLGHLPGRRLEADFGQIHVDFPDGRRLVPFLVTAWAYSNAPLDMALPFERTEAILEGMVAAFEFFGAVPKEVWWDYMPKHIISHIGHRHDLEEVKAKNPNLLLRREAIPDILGNGRTSARNSTSFEPAVCPISAEAEHPPKT